MNCEYCGEVIFGYDCGPTIHAKCVSDKMTAVLSSNMSVDDKLKLCGQAKDPLMREFLETAEKARLFKKDSDGQLLELIRRYLDLRNAAWDLYDLTRFAQPNTTVSSELIQRKLAAISERCGFRKEDSLRTWIMTISNVLE
jgi:hypothetical protein